MRTHSPPGVTARAAAARGAPHHVEDRQHVGGDVVPAVVQQHLGVDHHQRLHVQLFIPAGRRDSALAARAGRVLVRQDEQVLRGGLGHV